MQISFYNINPNTSIIKNTETKKYIKRNDTFCSSIKNKPDTLTDSVSSFIIQNISKLQSKFSGLKSKNCSMPEIGEIPEQIMKEVQTGEKGQITNKITGEIINPTAVIEQKEGSSYKTLFLYDKDKRIGHASYMIVNSDEHFINSQGMENYENGTGCLYVYSMGNSDDTTYSHVGTTLHRLLHKISKSSGCEGKMILDAAHKSHPFHYDSGFRLCSSFEDTDNEYFKLQNKIDEYRIAGGFFQGSRWMYLPIENMQKLENGEHCMPEEYKNLSIYECMDKIEELRKLQRNIANNN